MCVCVCVMKVHSLLQMHCRVMDDVLEHFHAERWRYRLALFAATSFSAAAVAGAALVRHCLSCFCSHSSLHFLTPTLSCRAGLGVTSGHRYCGLRGGAHHSWRACVAGAVQFSAVQFSAVQFRVISCFLSSCVPASVLLSEQ